MSWPCAQAGALLLASLFGYAAVRMALALVAAAAWYALCVRAPDDKANGTGRAACMYVCVLCVRAAVTAGGGSLWALCPRWRRAPSR